MRQQREQHVVVQLGAPASATRSRSRYSKEFVDDAPCDEIFSEGGVQEFVGALRLPASCLMITESPSLWGVNEEELSDDPLPSSEGRPSIQQSRFEYFDIFTEFCFANVLPTPVKHP